MLILSNNFFSWSFSQKTDSYLVVKAENHFYLNTLHILKIVLKYIYVLKSSTF